MVKEEKIKKEILRKINKYGYVMVRDIVKAYGKIGLKIIGDITKKYKSIKFFFIKNPNR